MLKWEPTHFTTGYQSMTLAAKRHKLAGRFDGKQKAGKKMLIQRGQFIRLTIDANIFDVLIPQDIEKKGQPNTMVQVHMRKKNLQMGGLKMVTCTKQAGPSVENKAQFWHN